MLTFLKTKIMLVPGYEDENIMLAETYSELVLRLWGSYNEAVAEADVGVYKQTGERITVRVVFPYVVDVLEDKIELCTNNCNCALSPKLTILREGNLMGRLYPYTVAEDFFSDFGLQISALLMDALQESLKKIHDAVYIQAAKQNICISERTTWGSYADRLVVIRKHQISHLFDPALDDYHKCDTVTLGSWLKEPKIETFPPGTRFYNVRGSTKDPKIPKPNGKGEYSWIELWQVLTETATLPPCCYYNAAANISNGHICSAMQPNRVLFGLHSVKELPQEVDKPKAQNYDEKRPVYIVPGCQRANSVIASSLVLQSTTKVVAMDHYFQKTPES